VTSPIDLWNSLLAGVDTSAMCARLSAQMRERRLRFGDRIICPFLRPFFLDAADEPRVRHVAETLWTLGERVATVALESPDMLRQLALSEAEVRLAAIDPGYATTSTAARADAFILPGSLQFAEYNGESPAGAGYSQGLAELFAEQPLMARFRERFGARLYRPVEALLEALIASYREWGGTASPPLVAIVDWRDVPTYSEFEILRDAFTVAEHQEGNLVALQAFFNHYSRSGLANHFSREHFGSRCCGFFFGFANDHAFACCQTICFYDYRHAETGKLMLDLSGGIADCIVRCRNAVTLHELLGEALAGFELCRGFGRPEHRPSAPGELIHYSMLKRNLGADHGEIGLNLVRQRHHRVHTLQVGRQAGGVRADAAITRRAINRGNARRLAQLPNQGVLAAPTSDDQNFHSWRHKVRGRRKSVSNQARGYTQEADLQNRFNCRPEDERAQLGRARAGTPVPPGSRRWSLGVNSQDAAFVTNSLDKAAHCFS
jgi:hypothetical protein